MRSGECNCNFEGGKRELDDKGADTLFFAPHSIIERDSCLYNFTAGYYVMFFPKQNMDRRGTSYCRQYLLATRDIYTEAIFLAAYESGAALVRVWDGVCLY